MEKLNLLTIEDIQDQEADYSAYMSKDYADIEDMVRDIWDQDDDDAIYTMDEMSSASRIDLVQLDKEIKEAEDREVALYDNYKRKTCQEYVDNTRTLEMLGGIAALLENFKYMPDPVEKYFGQAMGVTKVWMSLWGYSRAQSKFNQSCQIISNDLNKTQKKIGDLRNVKYKEIARRKGLTAQVHRRKLHQQRLLTRMHSRRMSLYWHRHRLNPRYAPPKLKLRTYTASKSPSIHTMRNLAKYLEANIKTREF